MIQNYPPTHILNTDETIHVLQLTDLHLYADISKNSIGYDAYQNFKACLEQALYQAEIEQRPCDLILLTGDLVNEVKSEIYDRIFSVLESTGVPFACIAGNHDVTDEVGSNKSFTERQFIAHPPDKRLLNRHLILANNWKILLINSSVSGRVDGEIDKDTLNWLEQTISDNEQMFSTIDNTDSKKDTAKIKKSQPILIVMHHHVIPMASDWINKHITKNAVEFWQILEEKNSVKAVINGHVHQDFTSVHAGIRIYSTPSTNYQFKPNQTFFTLDDNAKPGYRWL